MKTLHTAAIFATVLLGVLPLTGQSKPYRVGTTTANFLEIGAESAGSAMGEAYVSVARDLSAVYWNPAGLSFMNRKSSSHTSRGLLISSSAMRRRPLYCRRSARSPCRSQA
jgi:hypothetical protein